MFPPTPLNTKVDSMEYLRPDTDFSTDFDPTHVDSSSIHKHRPPPPTTLRQHLTSGAHEDVAASTSRPGPHCRPDLQYRRYRLRDLSSTAYLHVPGYTGGVACELTNIRMNQYGSLFAIRARDATKTALTQSLRSR